MLFRSLIPATLAVAPLSGLLAIPVAAQVVPQTPSSQVLTQNQSPQNYTVIHVNAVSGSDTSGDGSQFRPFQTISQALRVADRNSILSLAPGEYSAESGETFPLVMRSGVTIQGEVAAGTSRVTILGNGTFTTTNGTYMQVTVVGVDGAGLGHVTITNPNSSGYGLVVEQGRPVIRDNQFIGSGYAGVYVGGTAAPRLEQNLFSDNGSVGVVLAGQSRAEVIGNTFENTGTGIQISPGAEPRVIQNRVVSNRQGIVMASTAQPQLQDNEITRNRHNGLIDYTAAGKTDPSVRAVTVNAPPPLSPARAVPPGDGAIPSPPPSSAAESPSLEPPPQPGLESALVTPSSDNRSALTSPGLDTRPQILSLPLLGEDLGDGDDSADSPEADAAPTDSPVFNDLTQEDDSGDGPKIESTSDSSVSTVLANSGHAGEFSATVVPLQVIPPIAERPPGLDQAPEPEALQEADHRDSTAWVSDEPQPVQEPDETDPLPTVEANLEILQVPEMTIPTGQGIAQMPTLTANAAPQDLSASEPPPPPSRAAMLGLFYRLVVPGTDPTTQAEVKTLVPDAFRVNVDGQVMMQVGAYATETEAEAMAAPLRQQGLEVEVLHRP